MHNISVLDSCYGCGVCAAACPHQVIDMQESHRGFYEPHINNSDLCTQCGICLSICGFHNIESEESEIISSFAGWSDNIKRRQVASSGGVAYEIASHAIAKGYIYCGVKYDALKNRAVHYNCVNIDGLAHSLGSKYIPSLSQFALQRFSFKEKYIVFGTPCFIASLRRWIRLKKKEDSFILVDFFCHGVPSLRVWDKYINEYGLEGKHVAWRDKKTGWHDSWYIVAKDEHDKEVYRSPHVGVDDFYRFFLGHYGLSPCCVHSCKYKQAASSADIRLGDMWGQTYASNEQGVSSVVCFTERGKQFVSENEHIILTPHPFPVVAEGQMHANASKPWGYSMANLLLRTPLRLRQILSLIKWCHDLLTIPTRIIHKLH